MTASRAITGRPDPVIDDQPVDPTTGDADFPPAELQTLLFRADTDQAAGRGQSHEDVMAFLGQLRAELAAR